MQISKILFIAFIISGTFFPTNKTVAQTGSQNNLIPEIEAYIEKARVDWNVPGAAIGIIKNDTVIMAKGFGTLRSDNDKKVDENTLFGIASNTKAFTSAGIALLVDEGKLDWDDKVVKHLPYFELYDPYVTENMTIRDLLCHRSGLKTFSGDLLWYGTNYSREDVVRKASKLEPAYAFRTTFGYSNIFFLTAGLIIEQVTGKSYDEFIQERFFKPLNMQRSNTSITAFRENKNIASPHIYYNGNVMPINYLNWDNVAPAGSINSSITDMLNWVKMHLNNGVYNQDTLISGKSHNEMWKPQTIQEISNWEQQMFPSTHFLTYALGWETFDYHGRKIVTHNGGLDGMISQVIMVPEEKLGFVIFTNSASSLTFVSMYYLLDMFLNEFHHDYSTILLGYKEEAKKYDEKAKLDEENARVKKTKPSFELKDYAGTYVDRIYGDVVVEFRDNQLHINFLPTEIFKGTLSHWHFDVFKLNWNNPSSLPRGTVQFFMNADAEIEKMTIDVPNPDFDFTEFTFYKKK